MRDHVAVGDVLVHLALTLLPITPPEPRLISRNSERRAKLQHPVRALGDLDLRPGLVQVEPTTQFWRQVDSPAALDPHVPMPKRCHGFSMRRNANAAKR